jgi:hypothetical protein
MRKIAITLAVLSLCLVGTWSIPAAAEPERGRALQWVARPPLGQARAGLGVATANRQIFAIGGFSEGFVLHEEVEARRVAGRGTWHDLAPLPTLRGNLMTAGLGGLVYAVGGFPDTEEPPFTSDIVETFDPTSGRWATSAPLPEPRGAAGIAALNGLLYVAGGGDDLGSSNEMFVYDPDTDTWRSAAPMPTVRERLRLVASGRYLYAIGGQAEDGHSLTTVERYDPRSDSWTTMAPMLESRGLPCAVETSVGGRPVIVVVGGFEYDPDFTFLGARATTEVYDPATNQWTMLDVLLPVARGSFECAVEQDGTVLAIGGNTWVGATFVRIVPDVDALKIRPRDLR